ncbi:MAG: RNA polymerase sigma factor SigI [Acidimicrobiaceae bacterium]|nr:RNA polymerase sigma factor SigI [Acidimicrobiaceae bacterium]
MAPDDQLTAAWQEHHAHLVNLAFRMLGDVGEAEDAVSEAFSRLLVARQNEIEDQRGWLIVVTSRICLDRIRSARKRYELPADTTDVTWDLNAGPDWSADPADRVTLDDQVRLALLSVLQRLSPSERVVLVLHDVFRLSFDTIADTVGKSAPACRQLARRARQKVTAGQEGNGPGVRFSVPTSEQREVTDRFIAACASGDLTGLLAVLAPDVEGTLDLFPGRVFRGAHRVGSNILRLAAHDTTLVSYDLAGQPAVLGYHDRRVFIVLMLTITGGRVSEIHALGDPAVFSLLDTSGLF